MQWAWVPKSNLLLRVELGPVNQHFHMQLNWILFFEAMKRRQSVPL